MKKTILFVLSFTLSVFCMAACGREIPSESNQPTEVITDPQEAPKAVNSETQPATPEATPAATPEVTPAATPKPVIQDNGTDHTGTPETATVPTESYAVAYTDNYADDHAEQQETEIVPMPDSAGGLGVYHAGGEPIVLPEISDD